VVDDEEMIRWSLGEFLQRRGDEYELAQDGPEALDILRGNEFDILLTDLSMPKMHGLELVREARALRPQMVSMVLTGLGAREDVIGAIKEQVFDFIDKPIQDYTEFSLALERAGRQARLVRERDQLLKDLKNKNSKLEMSLAQLNEAYARLSRQEGFLEEDLRQAQRMHQRLLPRRFPDIAGLDFYGYFAPCARLGGDFFDVFPLGGERQLVGFYLADVAGHGVGAAMITVIVRELIHAHGMMHPESDLFEKPAETLKYINQGLLEENFEPPILVTMAYGVVDPSTGDVEIACAGHPEPLLITGKAHYTFAPASGPVLGIQTASPYRLARFRLDADNYFLLYSDGVSDARNALGEVLGDRKMAAAGTECFGGKMPAIGRHLEDALKHHQGTVALEDDQTFLAIGRMEKADEESVKQSLPSVHVVHPRHADMRQRAAIPAAVEVGWKDGTCVLALTGKATWRQAKLLCRTATEAGERGAKRMFLDLSRCQYLDSTLLGVLYQNADTWKIFGAQPELRGLFQEMGIVDHLDFSDTPPPQARMEARKDMIPPVLDRKLMLSAHESLASLSDENRERFGKVVDALRNESGEPFG
ncbi:MAG: SpoIIE family protein phosphatase, partial [Candidatus Sumerlaeota bacterium]